MNYEWKGPRTEKGQESVDLRKCDQETLQKYYDHCWNMMYNTDAKNPGRYVLIKKISDQLQHVRAELLVRWLRAEKHYPYQSCYEYIQTVISQNRDTFTPENVNVYPIGRIMDGIPDEYRRVPIKLVLQACMYSLGLCDTSYITLNFLIKLGLYFTQKEMQEELFERDKDGRVRNRMEVVKEREKIDPKIHINCNPSGLTYDEFHKMCKLHKDKYENYTTKQLKILSDKVLYRFQSRCEEQAKIWQDKLDVILAVANEKGYEIKQREKDER